jgi:hypothetical protein
MSDQQALSVAIMPFEASRDDVVDSTNRRALGIPDLANRPRATLPRRNTKRYGRRAVLSVRCQRSSPRRIKDGNRIPEAEPSKPDQTYTC